MANATTCKELKTIGKTKRLLVILLLLAACISASSQETSTLYRGLYPKLYPFKYNGSYYWENKQFTKGNVTFNGKYYEGVLMNIDAYTKNLLVRTDQNALPILLDRNQVQWFNWKGWTFVNLQYYGFEDAPEGFFALSRDGEVVLLSLTEKLFKHGTRNQGAPGEDDHYDEEAAVYAEYTVFGNAHSNAFGKNFERFRDHKLHPLQ